MQASPVSVAIDVGKQDILPAMYGQASTSQMATGSGEDLDLEEILKGCLERMTPDEKGQALTLLKEHRAVFASSNKDMGRTTKVKHRIDTGSHPRIRQPVRRVPVERRGAVRKEVQDMLKRGVIQPSTSPWASPLVLVRKKDEILH